MISDDSIPQINPKWLIWARQLDAHAQNGLTYCKDPFDRERFSAIRNIAAEIMAEYSNTDFVSVKNLFDSQTGYMTPKIDVRGVVFKDEKILLVKEKSDGGWTLPGGWVDIHEPPSLAVEREVWEESGFEVKTKKLLAIYDRDLHHHPPHAFHIYKLFFGCDLFGGKATPSIETSGVDFFAEDQLPPLSITRTTLEEINRMFAHNKNPGWATDFD